MRQPHDMGTLRIPKVVREFINILQEEGCEIINVFRGANHYRAQTRVGSNPYTFTIPSTTGDQRSVKNFRTQSRRTIQALKELK